MENGDNQQVISKGECAEILQNALNRPISEIDVINFKLDSVEKDVLGLMGEYFNLIISAKVGNKPELKNFEFFIKTIPAYGAHAEYIKECKLFPKEAGQYSTLFREIDNYGSSKWHADCYYVRPNLLVMENLRKLHYRHVAEDEFFSLGHLKVALRRLAAMHASSIIFEEKTGINIGKKYAHLLEQTCIYHKSDWFQVSLETIKQVAKTLPKFQNDAAQKFIQDDFLKYKNKMIEVVQTSEEFRNVFCHRDAWRKNLLFKYDEVNATFPIDCMFVDFQMTTYGPAALDVLNLIYVNTAKKFRDTHMNELLHYYYDCLCKELKPEQINPDDHMTWDDFVKSCNYVKILTLSLSAIFTQLGFLPGDFLMDFMRNDPSGFIHCVAVERFELVRNQMKINKAYENRMVECVEEIIEYAMDNKNLIS